ncbi:MAG: heparan-alpha-glucosaminide N-acetyltransferase domain-containing protein [Promethearchaeota archaeon]
MKRLKSIDAFRGFIILIMLWIHLYDWWVVDYNSWLLYEINLFLAKIFAPSFLFVSGISTFLWYKNKIQEVSTDENYNFHMMRNEYLFRASSIFIIAIIYNSFTVIRLNNISWIWTWYMLLSISVSLFMAWPLLKCSVIFRIFIAIGIWIINHFILAFLLPYKGQFNLYGGLFHILYNSLDFDPILVYFPFFLFGTVVGNIIFDIFIINNQQDRRIAFKNKFLVPSSILGFILIGLHFFPFYPLILIDQPFPLIIFALGFNLLIVTFLVSVEEFNLFETKKSYKFTFYFSYYSLTIYLSHNILYFLFRNQINPFYYFFVIIIVIIGFQLTLREVYKKWGSKASLKVQIARLSSGFAKLIEKRNNSYNELNSNRI